VHLEHQVLRWFRELVGFPAEGGGLLVSGGSMASLTALAAARHAKAGFDVGREGLQGGRAPLVIYLSSEGHGCLRKAARVLGIGSDHVREVPVDAAYRMDVAALQRAIAADRARGWHPLAVCASAGTVNTGAIDPLAEIAALARREDLWLHVDGAYGAPALLGKELGQELRDVALADSLALDPHKWLGVPVEAGLLLVRRAETLRAAFQLQAAYLPAPGGAELDEVAGPAWFSDFGFQQTRGFRALKVWAVLKHLGVEGLASRIDEAIRLARALHARVLAEPELEPLAPQSLSVVCFRFAPRALRADEPALEDLNRRLLRRVQLGGEAFLSGTRLAGRFALRACIVNDRTREADVQALVDAVLRQGRAAAGA
jgi:glutamate/tyrosine decarboxylase-like PLP-dependent enzyme